MLLGLHDEHLVSVYLEQAQNKILRPRQGVHTQEHASDRFRNVEGE